MEFDEYLITIADDKMRENLKLFFEKLVADGRPIKSVYIENKDICVVPEGSGR